MPNLPIGFEFTLIDLRLCVCVRPWAMHKADFVSISLLDISKCSNVADLISTSDKIQIGGGFFESYGP